MKKAFLASLPCLGLLLSCSVASSSSGEFSYSWAEESSCESFSESERDKEGTYHVFDASSLSKTPLKEEKQVVIDGFEFAYFNVYRDDENGIVLQNKESYIRNDSILFGLLFHSDLAAAYHMDEENGNGEECELTYEREGFRSYTIFPRGFEIAIDKSLSKEYTDISIGSIEHWC